MGLTSENLISRIQRIEIFLKMPCLSLEKSLLGYICFIVPHQKGTVFLFQGNLMFPIIFIDKCFLLIQVTVLITRKTEQNRSPQSALINFFKQISMVPKEKMNPERRRGEFRST